MIYYFILSVAVVYKTICCEKKCLHISYCQLLKQYFTYCVEVWGNVYKRNMSPIIKFQKRAIRIIYKAGYCKTTNHFFLHFKLRCCAFKNKESNVLGQE